MRGPRANADAARSAGTEANMRVRIVCRVLGGVAAVALVSQAQATWKPEYADNPPEVQDWYRNAELTEAAKIRFPFKKCCDHADVVKTKFNVNRTNSGDEWYWLDGDHWRRIPNDVIHWGRHAPGGQPTLFIYSGKETCFFPGDGGI